MNLVDTFKEFSSGKSIDSPTMVRVLEDVFRTLIKKKFTTDDNFNIIVNANRGDLELWRVREIVPDGEVTDELSEISYSEALAVDEDYEVGEECYEQLFLEDFGRRSIMAARQTLISRIMDLEKDELYKQYTEREGELVLCEVQQILKREILVIDDANGRELVMPRVETIRGDYFRKGDMVRGIIKEVEMRNNNNPVVIVSRTDERFLAKLMEQEVPEIEDGLITIKGIVRIPGERAKVSVESYDDRIDPVGACVGMKGSRIHGIVRELNQENIDVINFTNNTNLYIQRSLTPARVSNIELDMETRRAKVYLEPDQVSLAIGKGGTNIKLASRLVEFEIDVYRNNEVEIDDVDLEEFKDEIEMWVLDAFKSIGCDTARSVLELSVEELVRRTDLEEETVRNVVNVLAAEFDDVEVASAAAAAAPAAEAPAKAAAPAVEEEVKPAPVAEDTPAPEAAAEEE
ncbi:transcription termination factor NusA [Neolewinella agarilytica]|uniref:Transcription termination/antitermination protein NusA n=1 Tax=Neolewinella agarilytica TaxID=478744 RepID=A0A1H9B750_9BACT|nr:transcription termination factor NusA [Neolewinella agarilytica]SEP84784.1 NusA antitermination factor [Neolewinella agarilytica]